MVDLTKPGASEFGRVNEQPVARVHRPAIPVLACLLLLSTVLMGQQASLPDSIPKFTARTELVTVPVVVMRRGSPWRQLKLSGWIDEHVAGLSKDDFRIEEDGQPKPIASFEEISKPESQLKPVAPPAGVYTNEVTADGPVTMVVILLDLINTPYFYREPAKDKLLEYLERDYRADRPTMLAALHPGGLRILHDFTTDPQVLANIVRRLKGSHEHDAGLGNQAQTEASGGLYQQIDVTREYDTLAAAFRDDPHGPEAPDRWLQYDHLEATFYELQQLAHALSALKGMKTLVWATGGITLPYCMSSRAGRLGEEYVQTLRLLSAAGIAVYPIDTVLATETGPVAIQVVQNFMDITRRTGGDYCLLRKDPDLCFRKAVDYDSQYYLLSYYTRSPAIARWRKINVKVRGKDVVVRARSGFFSGGANGDPEERRKRDIVQAVTTPVEYRGLPISVRWTVPGEQPAGKPAGQAAPSGEPQPQPGDRRSFKVGISPDGLTVDTADHNHIKLDIVAVALDPSGNVLTDSTQQIDLHPGAPEMARLRSGGFVYSGALEVKPETSKVRFIVRDGLSERLGTVSTTIETQP